MLRKHGLVDGDIIRLKVFCRKSDTSDRKEQLKDVLKSSKRLKKNTANENQPKSKMVYLSWENYDKNKDKWCIVKSEKGGGTKQIKLSLEATKSEILDSCVKYFWEKRSKKYFIDSHFLLADFKHETISDTIKNDREEEVPFTLGGYCSTYKMTRPRIFFRTKPKTAYQRLSEHLNITNDDDDDDFQPHLPTSNSFASSTLLHNSSLSSFSSVPSPSILVPPSSPLDVPTPLSTCPFVEIPEAPSLSDQNDPVERRELIRNQDIEYEDSLRQDMDKDREKRQEEEEVSRLELLRQAREYRVKEETKLDEEHVVVAVRHPYLKTQTRFFGPTSLMSAVYDWVGSLAIHPEHYQLYNAFRVPVPPDYKVEAGVYNMREIEHPLLMTPNGTVAFVGYGVTAEVTIDTSNASSMSDLRKQAFDALREDEVRGIVDRENIYDSLLQFYSKEKAYLYQYVILSHDGENAVGDGVVKDAFSQFFNELGTRWEGCREVVPSMSYQSENLDLIGRIITHAYLLFEMFPFQISHAALKYYLFGDVSDKELFTGFLKHLPERESECLEHFNVHSQDARQACIDVLTEFRIFEAPHEDNIKTLCIKAGRIALIQTPCFNLQKLVTGMEFFKNISSELFDKIYLETVPTSTSIIESIHVRETTNHEQNITTWLHRYVRCCTPAQLATFLRFITASSSMLQKKIKLHYVDQQTGYLRPTSETCFCILNLPRQYSSFTDLRNNLNRWIQNDSTVLWQMSDD